MMKTILSFITVALLSFSAFAQTNTPPLPPPLATNAPAPPSIPEIPSRILDFLSASATNWYVAAYGIYSTDLESFGAGIAGAYAITPNVVSVLRLDYLDGEIWLPSGSVQLQYPITVAGKLKVTPFIFGGIATALSGHVENGSAVGIAGSGLATRFNEHLGVLYDIEMWSGFSGAQHRFGLYWKF